jgi:uncharacterized protein (TIGR02391 family)
LRPQWKLTVEEIMALPLDALAIEVLNDYHQGDFESTRTWMTQAHDRLIADDGGAVRKLAEAWAWLQTHGLVAMDLPRTHDPFGLFVTRAGERALRNGLSEVQALESLNIHLHPDLLGVRSIYLLGPGHFATAVFDAFKAVEVRVRAMAGLASLFGVPLMNEAFNRGGPLRLPAGENEGEQDARMYLFAGALGFLKNPPSHRHVEYQDATEAAEAILLADLLMRILDRIEREIPETN